MSTHACNSFCENDEFGDDFHRIQKNYDTWSGRELSTVLLKMLMEVQK